MSLDRKSSREIGKGFTERSGFYRAIRVLPSDQGFTERSGFSSDQGFTERSGLSQTFRAFPGVQAVSLRQPVETDVKKRMISACLGEELGHNARRDRDHASRFTIPTSPGPIWLANRAGSVFHGSFKRR
jgi:hypothetical protein